MKNAIKLTGNYADAEDLVQQTMLKATRHIDKFRCGDNLGGWAFVMMKRIHLDAVDKAKRRAFVRMPEFYDVEAPEKQDETLSDEVSKAVSGLEADHNEVITLHYLLGMTLPEVAEMLKIPLGTVQSRLGRALEQLRKELQSE